MKWIAARHNFGSNAEFGHFKARIHRWLGEGDILFLSIAGLFECRALESQTLEFAQREAEDLIIKVLKTALAEACV